MLVATKAIVFSAIKYAEADLIVTCFTEEAGLKTYMLRGILKSKKGKIKASYFQPLTQLELIADHKNRGNLEYLREAKIFYPYKSLHTNIVKSSLVMFLSEMLKNCIREEEKNLDLYNFLENSLISLDEKEQVANFHIYFLLELSNYLGFYPDASNSNFPYFNVLEGNFQVNDTDDYCLEGVYIEEFKRFFGVSMDTLEQISLNKTNQKDILNLILNYYQLHIQGYRKPKSLAILNQIFT